jgi:thiosulfate/3-mercaptopyruvate sulfurtransferase
VTDLAMPFTALISADALRDAIHNPDWLVFDTRHALADTHAGRAAYAAGHLPGAVFLHLDDDLAGLKTGTNGRHPLPERDAFARALAQLGLRPDTQVIAYDAGDGSMAAARLWWMLRWLGHEAVAVLDGGVAAWVGAGGTLTRQAAGLRVPGPLPVRAPLVDTVTTADVLENLGTRRRLVVDARAADRFRGENETVDARAGHIPGAINRPFKDNLRPDGRFKSAGELRSEFATLLGDVPPTSFIMQCGSGVTACHNLLALEIAGLSGAALYAGSWSEWSSDPARPSARSIDAS